MSSWKKLATGVVAVGTLGLGFWASKAAYTVKEVLDGDTFVTTEGQHIRFDSVNSPGISRCMGKEAKEELERLVLNKRVFLKTTFVDGYKRMVSSVYTINGNVGEKLLKKGLATFSDKGTQKGTGLAEIAKRAREAKVGVYSSRCTQSENLTKPKCNIKGNVTSVGKQYRYPGCGQYNNTLVQLYLEDEWFCTINEAKAAGFKKGSDCP